MFRMSLAVDYWTFNVPETALTVDAVKVPDDEYTPQILVLFRKHFLVSYLNYCTSGRSLWSIMWISPLDEETFLPLFLFLSNSVYFPLVQYRFIYNTGDCRKHLSSINLQINIRDFNKQLEYGKDWKCY